MKRTMRWILAAVLAIGVIVPALIQFGCSASDKYQAMKMEGPGLAEHVRAAQADLAPLPPTPSAQNAPPVIDHSTELWIIERKPDVAPPADDKLPGAGTLLANDTGAEQPPDKLIPVPLQHTDVKASIAGSIASVDVTQQYQNPFSVKIEATYVFPLPHDAAVSDFIMTVGDRKIRGIIRERQEAERIYREARSQGYVASLLTQERPNIFTQTVGNIEPGKRIDINIRYFHTLACSDGWFEFVFPMVVGPRFNPPGSTAGIGAVGRGSRGVSGQTTEVSYLRPGERSGHDIALSVDLQTPMPIQDIASTSHQVQIQRSDDRHAAITLASEDRIPNRDFILRYRLAAGQMTSGALAVREARGGYFTMLLVPPASITELRRGPVEMVFTIDTSGSMSGRPIAQARAAVHAALGMMNAGDTFQIIRFGNQAEKMASQPLPATPDNIRRGLRFVDSLQAGGGTMMTDGMRASLRFPHDESHLRYVVFLTDGFIGNESDVLTEIADNLGPARIFSFGVGSSVNRYLMEEMARLGNGAAAFLALNDDAAQVMSTFFQRISHPALTDIALDPGSSGIHDLYPRRLPDLFAGRAVMLSGRFSGELNGQIHVRARAAGQTVDCTVPVTPATGPGATAIPLVWARTRLADLGTQFATGHGASPDEIRTTALEYGLMSPFTAFVAVDASRRTEGTSGISVPVPVQIPDGVRYDTTVEERPNNKQQ